MNRGSTSAHNWIIIHELYPYVNSYSLCTHCFEWYLEMYLVGVSFSVFDMTKKETKQNPEMT